MRRNNVFISIILLVSFVAALSGCVISPRLIPGQPTPTPSATPTPTATPSPTPTPTPIPPTPHGKLYVTNQDSNSILRFDNALNATGNVAPGAIISGATTTLAAPQFIALDATADRLYVANANGPSVLIFDGISTKNGNIAPTRNIIGANTQFVTPSSVAIDKGRDLLYVADGVDIYVFTASTANGDLAPTRDIVVSFNIQQIFVDAANDRLYASDAATNAIDVFDSVSTLNSTQSATRTITGAQTLLAQPTGMAIDSSGNLIVTNQGNGTITVYSNAAGASGNQAPIATIGGAATTLASPAQIIQSSAANEVYVADSTSNEVVVFSGIAGLSGGASPTRTIAGPATTLTTGTTARGVALDATR